MNNNKASAKTIPNIHLARAINMCEKQTMKIKLMVMSGMKDRLAGHFNVIQEVQASQVQRFSADKGVAENEAGAIATYL